MMDKIRLKNIILYGGVDKETYQSISLEINKQNQISLVAFSLYAAVAMLGLFLTSIFQLSIANNRILYFVAMIIFFFISFFSATIAKKNATILHIIMYLYMLVLFLFGISIGLITTPDERTVTFMVLLVGAPLLMNDRPYRIAIFILLVIIGFIVTAKLIKTGDVYRVDVINALFYGLLSIAVSTYKTCFNIARIKLARENKILSDTDQLTGLYNRRCVVRDVNEIKLQKEIPDIVFGVFDLNGLKEVNDHKGHAEGDYLLKNAAECINSFYKGYGKCYRIGGDEFLVILENLPVKITDIGNIFCRWVEDWSKKHNIYLSISYGFISYKEHADKSVEEIIRMADDAMYENKSTFYKRFGLTKSANYAAFNLYCKRFVKIAKINLTEDMMYPIVDDKMSENESRSYSNECLEALKKGVVYNEDVDFIREKLDIAYLRNLFTDEGKGFEMFYRKKFDDGYKRVVIEMIRAEDYTDENQTVYAYIKIAGKELIY